MTRVAAVDIGSHSTRLLVIDGERVVDRASVVTGLGEGVDRSGRLGDEPRRRVLRVLEDYRARIGGARAAAVMTSAVRDARNGEAFARQVGAALGFGARILSGDEEAELTFAGATAHRDGHGDSDDPVLVIDIGGGSTELVLGACGVVSWHASTQIGVVRHSERHLHNDPPTSSELEALRADVRLPDHPPAACAIAVGGTPTQCAAIDLGLTARIEGHVLTVARLDDLLARLSAVPLAERARTPGLDPARAPVIVAGIAILLEVMSAFALEHIEVSERDILWGLARSTHHNAR